MIVFRLLLALVFGLVGTAAYAGYAQAVPPPGWGGSRGAWTYAAASNGQWLNSTVRTNAALNVGGRSVVLNASLRMAANAPRFAAAAIFMHPGIRTAAGIAAWLLAAGLFYDELDGLWKKKGGDDQFKPSDGYEYNAVGSGEWFSTAQAACNDAGKVMYGAAFGYATVANGNTFCYYTDTNGRYLNGWGVYSRQGNCPVGWYVTPAGCVQNAPLVPVPQEEFVQKLPGSPMPDTVPNELPPGTPLPVELPQIEPATAPTGAPYSNPNKVNDPANPYVQPYQRIMPYPTEDAPWQVDVSPQLQPVPTPDPAKNPPIPTPDAKPPPTPNPPPVPDPPPEPPQPDLCEKYPDINACQKPKPEADEKFEDTALGDVPKLYTQKYPDGLAGVWRTRSAELKASPLLSVLGNLMPQVAGGGAPPQIIVSLDVGIRDFGAADLSPPLYVWQFGGLVIVTSALLLARALVFGG